MRAPPLKPVSLWPLPTARVDLLRTPAVRRLASPPSPRNGPYVRSMRANAFQLRQIAVGHGRARQAGVRSTPAVCGQALENPTLVIAFSTFSPPFLGIYGQGRAPWELKTRKPTLLGIITASQATLGKASNEADTRWIGRTTRSPLRFTGNYRRCRFRAIGHPLPFHPLQGFWTTGVTSTLKHG